MKRYKIGIIILFMMIIKTGMSKDHADGIIITNAGINGNNTLDLLGRLEKDVLNKKPDLVVLMIGTNDMLSTRNRISVKQYAENYQKLISEIKRYSSVIIMTIPPVNASYIISRQGAKSYEKTGPQARVDSANAVIMKLAKLNSCPLIDLYGILQACGGASTERDALFQNELNTGTEDGVHPTINGYRVIGTAVFQAISLIQPKARNIVCFGDSITFGYEMNGQGTVEGDSYPAVLKRMMDNALKMKIL